MPLRKSCRLFGIVIIALWTAAGPLAVAAEIRPGAGRSPVQTGAPSPVSAEKPPGAGSNPAVTGASSAVAITGVALMFYLIAQAAKRPPARDPRTGELILRFPAMISIVMGSIAVGAPIGIGLLTLVIPMRGPADIYVILALGAFFLLTGGSVLPYFLKTEVRVGAEKLVAQGVFFRNRTLRWTEIAVVRFKDGALVLSDHRKVTVKIERWFIGAKAALEILAQQLPQQIQERSATELQKFRTAVGR